MDPIHLNLELLDAAFVDQLADYGRQVGLLRSVPNTTRSRIVGRLVDQLAARAAGTPVDAELLDPDTSWVLLEAGDRFDARGETDTATRARALAATLGLPHHAPDWVERIHGAGVARIPTGTRLDRDPA